MRHGMALAYLTGDYTMKAIAAEFGVHYTQSVEPSKNMDQKNLVNRILEDLPGVVSRLRI
jgi:hypothetical protein